MIAFRHNLQFSAITLAAIIMYGAAAPVAAAADVSLLIISLLITGIPHGAIDHVIYAARENAAGKKPRLIRNFFIPYLLLIGLTFILWMVIPEIMFWVFLAIAGYHFGQSQLYYFPFENRHFLKCALYVGWGMMLLAALWIAHWDTQISNINSLFAWDMQKGGLLYNIVWGAGAAGFIVSVAIITHFWVNKKVKGVLAITELFVILILFIMIRTLSLYSAFAIYFGLWHSMRVIFTEYHFLQKAGTAGITKGAFLKSFLPFSLLSIAGLVILIGSSYLLQGQISPFMLFLIFISALTMPHVFFMEKMYTWLSDAAALRRKGAMQKGAA